MQKGFFFLWGLFFVDWLVSVFRFQQKMDMLRENYNGQTVEDRQKERDAEHFVTVLFEEKDKKAAEGAGKKE